MAYDNPTAADLKARFAKFAAVDDDTVEFWLERARRSVDTSWTEGDYAFAQMLLACHYMTLEGLGTGAESEAAAAGASGFKSIRSGSFSLERFDSKSGDAGGSQYDATGYGKQFKDLLRQNRGGARVSPTGTVPFDRCRYPHGEA